MVLSAASFPRPLFASFHRHFVYLEASGPNELCRYYAKYMLFICASCCRDLRPRHSGKRVMTSVAKFTPRLLIPILPTIR
jgi:hypothetical protein